MNRSLNTCQRANRLYYIRILAVRFLTLIEPVSRVRLRRKVVPVPYLVQEKQCVERVHPKRSHPQTSTFLIENFTTSALARPVETYRL